MAQPEVHNVPVKSQPAHWLSEEITALVNHMYDNQSYADGLGNFKPQVYTSVVMTINNGPLQSMRIGPAKTIKMVKSKWASLNTIHYAIDKYHNQTGTHWDNTNGAGIHGPAASVMWDSYVAHKSNHPMHPFHNTGWVYFEKMQEIIPLGGTRGCHAFHPGVMEPPPVPNGGEDEADMSSAAGTSSAVGPFFAAGPLITGPSSISGLPSIASPSSAAGPSSISDPFSAAGPSSISGPPPITGPSFATGPHSITGSNSTATSSASAKCTYEGTTIDSVETRSFASTHKSMQPVSTTLVSSPPSKKACSQTSTHISQKMSNAVKMSSATQAAKIMPAAAVMGIQGTVNHLTDVFKKYVLSSMAGSMLLPLPPPPLALPVPSVPESSMDLVAR